MMLNRELRSASVQMRMVFRLSSSNCGVLVLSSRIAWRNQSFFLTFLLSKLPVVQ
jgi:hypothetical protein